MINKLVPTPSTLQVLNEAEANLPFGDRDDFDEHKRGFIASYSNFNSFTAKNGAKVWRGDEFDFVHDEASAKTVHPSLLRLARLNNTHGLFEVTAGVYQIRGFDLANMTILEGNSGIVIIDPLTTTQMARASLDLYHEHRGERPVKAIIYTHSHADHYGGALGVVDKEDVDSGQVRILAPSGFVEEAVSENVFAGNAMRRRSHFQFGSLLERGPDGTVDAGIGMTMGAGQTALLAPTETTEEERETVTIDGIEIDILQASNTEAPSEFILWFPAWKMLNLAELATHTMHNLLTPRGAQVRDASAWWKTLHSSLVKFGGSADILIGQHHWPTWGNERIRSFIAHQRDMYKFIHDESLRRANHGQTMQEISEDISLPDALQTKWHTRGYYGSINHNSKAVYQRYLGWWDGNPLTYHQLPPSESGALLVEMLGGPDAALDKLDEYFASGNYRWVAQLCSSVLFANPENKRARELGAAALEQMAIQTENASWRNVFLSGAQELLQTNPRIRIDRGIDAATARAMTDEQILDYTGICFNGETGQNLSVSVNWVQPPSGVRYLIEVRNGVVIYTKDAHHSGAVTVTAGRAEFVDLLNRAFDIETALDDSDAKINGNRESLVEFLSHIDRFERFFPVTLP